MKDSGSGELEDRLDDLSRRVAQLEAATSLMWSTGGRETKLRVRAASAAERMTVARPLPPTQPPLRERLGLGDQGGLEDLLGGRVLAWVGGVAVLLGLALLFAVAVSNGWIGEGARSAFGAAGSVALLALGVWLHERKARTDAALAAVATGLAGLFLTLTVATQVYELLPSLLGTLLAVLVGAAATGLALRWKAKGIAALGILGALAAPILAGASYDAGTVSILFVALAAAAGVLLWQRWGWLALAAFALATPQWLIYLFQQDAPASVLATLIAFGALGVVMAVGYDVRSASDRLELQSAFLLGLNAFVVAGAGWFALDGLGQPTTGKVFFAALALAHVAVGLAGSRRAHVSDDLGLLALTLGVLLADVAFALVAHGVLLTLGWTAAGVGFAALLRHAGRGDHAEVLIGSGLGVHLALGLATALLVDDTQAVLAGDATLSIAGAAASALLAAGCLVSARIVGAGRRHWRTLLDGCGLAAVAFLTALMLDGEALALVWVGQVLVLTGIARRHDDAVAGWGALGFLALASVHVLVYELPPVSLVTGLDRPLIALAAAAGLAGAALLAAQRLPRLHPVLSPALTAYGALALLYIASALVVTPFESGGAVESTLLSAHQQGQMVLSVFWALVGLGALVVGLRRDLHALRLAALGLLGVTATKVFLFDFATLTSVYRVVSFIGLGLLLLIGAFVWQRLRPRALQDLREAPAGVR